MNMLTVFRLRSRSVKQNNAAKTSNFIFDFFYYYYFFYSNPGRQSVKHNNAAKTSIGILSAPEKQLFANTEIHLKNDLKVMNLVDLLISRFW